MRDCFKDLVLPDSPVLVEIGSIRELNDYSAGYSTPYLADLAKKLDGSLHVCDIERANIELAKSVTLPIYDQVYYYCCDAEEFTFNKPIDFLYLDSMDCSVTNYLQSATHHLDVFLRLRHLIGIGSYVAIDDCYTLTQGKGAILAPYLMYCKQYELINPGYTMLFRRIK